MRDISGNVIINFGANHCRQKLGGPDDEASCRFALQVDAVSKNVLSVCKVIDTGNYRLQLDTDGNDGSYLVRELTQGRVRLIRRGFTFCLDAREARSTQVCYASVLL